jgi:phosphoglycolate phosphatase-like HAD superfamily hydrolase
MKKYNISPKECAVIGDYIADINSGKEIGCHTIAVLTGGTNYEILEKAKPDIILKGVYEIPIIFDI